MMKPAALILGLVLAATSAAYAQSGNENANSNNGGGKQYELVDGTTFTNAGAMFQYLRDRDNGYAAGNPRDIVDAYPDEFENVGDLIHQKRVED